MTVRIQLITTDDVDERQGVFTDTGPDGETVIFALDGELVELHLTKNHADELREAARPWLDAGHAPGQPPQPPREPERKHPDQGKRREIPGTRTFFQDLREWADSQGIEIPVTIADGKKNYTYLKDLKVRYAVWLTEQAAQHGADGDAARARLAFARRLGFPVPDGARTA
jgi:hypothetical protein